MENTEYILETDDLCYKYENSKVLSMSHINIKIKKGVKTILLGANGAGKSTLFFHFNGVFKPTSGCVKYNGEELKYNRKALSELRSEIAVVLQNPDDQIFSATVEEDIAFGPMNLGLPIEEVEKRVDEALFQVGLTEFRSKPTAQLSYGQRKRVAFAGAIAMKSKVLILDEPTAGLDPQMALELMELAEQLHNGGTTVVISTHDVDLAYTWADEIHVLRKSQLIYSGESEDFYADPVNVHMAGLVPPSMYTINKNLCEINNQNDWSPYPRTPMELLCKIEGDNFTHGHIHLISVGPNCSTEDVSEAAEKYKNHIVGVYGTDARRAMFKLTAKIDYVFNAFENCMVEFFNGKDVALFYSESIKSLVLDSIKDLERFGVHIDIEEDCAIAR